MDWRYAKEPRSAVARLWGGIEALFEVNQELVFRISLLSACLLEPRGPRRKRKFDAVKALYSGRSKIVHGEPMDENKVVEILSESFDLLRSLLLVAVEKGRVPTKSDLDDVLFC